MLRFRPPPEEAASETRRRNPGTNRQRWRLWMLLVALGLVVATMQRLNHPDTARRLGQIFGASEVATPQQKPVHQFVLGGGENMGTPIAATERNVVGVDASDALSLVKDNTYFRPTESEAWFGLFARLQEMDAQQLRDAALGEVTYAQLLRQPQVYRGQVVTVRGVLRREEVEHPAENALGFDTYHRLVIQPRGGGHWPFVVYCLDLPSGLPRGDHLQEPIAVTGFFFKNWSYAWQDGLGIAPVVLASKVDWQPTLAAPVRRALTSQNLTTALAIAGAIAALTVFLVLRNTRRPRRTSPAANAITFPEASSVETIQERLERLAATEPQE